MISVEKKERRSTLFAINIAQIGKVTANRRMRLSEEVLPNLQRGAIVIESLHILALLLYILRVRRSGVNTQLSSRHFEHV